MIYPSYPTQPYDGSPFPYDQGPPDALPSGESPFHDIYDGTRGRSLGALGHESKPYHKAPTADGPDYKDYPNELDTLADADDVQGNGIFDASNTHGNIHPDAGVFADRENLPGYLAREKFFQPSEVIDVTTGQPIMYVPGNAFMMDPRTDHTLAEVALYVPGLPGSGGHQPPMQRIDEPNDGEWAIGADDSTTPAPSPDYQPAPKANMFLVAAIAGLAIGAVAGIMWKG